MTFHVTDLKGTSEAEVSANRMREILEELLAFPDNEHSMVSLTHETEWSLGVFARGLLVWENLEKGAPRHLLRASPERTLELWQLLAAGKLREVEAEAWLPGYGRRE